jgi:predicted ATP-grasp superfamily ATP-dependent carboligase
MRTVRPGKIYEVERQAEQQVEYRVQYLEQAGEDPDPEETWAERMEAAETAVRNWMEEAEWEDIGSDWVMQELVPGIHEYSTSLLVDNGRIVDYACSRYEFSSETYVWPALDYSRSEYVSVPQSHLEVMSAFLLGFTGICNFNYKLRPNGQMCIFEVNPRVGGDLVFDVPKPRVRAMFEKLDAMFR